MRFKGEEECSTHKYWIMLVMFRISCSGVIVLLSIVQENASAEAARRARHVIGWVPKVCWDELDFKGKGVLLLMKCFYFVFGLPKPFSPP